MDFRGFKDRNKDVGRWNKYAHKYRKQLHYSKYANDRISHVT